MGKDSTRVPAQIDDESPVGGEGGATTDGKGGYLTGQGGLPLGDDVSTDQAGTGSSA